MKCIDCHSAWIIYTIPYIVCKNCGVCQDIVYDSELYSPSIQEVSEYSQPLFNDNHRSIHVIERLLQWSNIDVTIHKKQQLIAHTTMLKDRLKMHNITYPSEYFIAGALIFANTFNRCAKEGLEYLSSDYSETHEQMLENGKYILQHIIAITTGRGKSDLLYVTTELNNNISNYYDNYLIEYWGRRIKQVKKIKTNGKTEKEILERARVPRRNYYRAKKRLSTPSRRKKRERIIQGEIADIIQELYIRNMPVRDIQVELALITKERGDMVNIHYVSIARYIREELNNF